MTRDFAKKPRPSARQSTASKGRGKPAPATSRAPAWVWLLTGTVLGAFIMFLVYLSGVKPQPAPAASGAAPATAGHSQVPKPRFDFYTLLKENEVSVKPPSGPARPPGQQPGDEEYILQVGSFKKMDDADRLRAELILMNLDAQVETVTVRNGQTWHRVLVGPYHSSSNVAKARSVLASNNINPLLLKRKREP